MTHENDERDEDERDEDERDEDERDEDAAGDDEAEDAVAHAEPAKKAAPAPQGPTFPEDALHASFEAARKADLDAVPEREAAKWFTYTVIGIAVYGAVVIYWIYL